LNYDPTTGNLLSTTDAAGNKTTYTYDGLSRRISAKLPDKTTQGGHKTLGGGLSYF